MQFWASKFIKNLVDRRIDLLSRAAPKRQSADMRAQNMTKAKEESQEIRKNNWMKILKIEKWIVISLVIAFFVIVVVTVLVVTLTRDNDGNKSESTSQNQGMVTSTPSHEMSQTPNSIERTSQNPLEVTPSSTFGVPTSHNPVEITPSLSSERTSTPTSSMMVLCLSVQNTRNISC